MRDYWLTQYLLAAVGWGYAFVCAGALALALWLPKAKAAKAIATVVVLGLASIPPIQGYKAYRKDKQAAEEFQARYAKARALFDERCKTAGEKIYRTVEGVEGVFLMKSRPKDVNLANQYVLDDPYGRDSGGDAYISSFFLGRNSDGSWSRKHTRNAFKFVELEDPESKVLNRYHVELDMMLARNDIDFGLKKELVSVRRARYGVDWTDLSSKGDRDHWIAGSLLRVVDLTTGEVVGERVGYMFDRGLDDQKDGRSPWAYAEYQACPEFEKSSGGYPSKSSRSREFILRVLKPIQGE